MTMEFKKPVAIYYQNGRGGYIHKWRTVWHNLVVWGRRPKGSTRPPYIYDAVDISPLGTPYTTVTWSDKKVARIEKL